METIQEITGIIVLTIIFLAMVSVILLPGYFDNKRYEKHLNKLISLSKNKAVLDFKATVRLLRAKPAPKISLIFDNYDVLAKNINGSFRVVLYSEDIRTLCVAIREKFPVGKVELMDKEANT